MKIVRYGMAVVLSGAALWLAALATRDCSLGPYLAANCLSLAVSRKSGLAFTPFLRSAVLEMTGLVLVGALYVAFRFVLPRPGKRTSGPKETPFEEGGERPVSPKDENRPGLSTAASPSRASMEKLVLSALCGRNRPAALELAKAFLSDYEWIELTHQVLFQALASLPTDDPAVLRRELPARMTRRGFPDFDLNEFTSEVSLRDAEMMIRRLTAEKG